MLWQSADLLRPRPLPWQCIPILWEQRVLCLSPCPQLQWIGMSCICWPLWLRRIALRRGVTSHTLAAVCFRDCPLVECLLSSLSTSSSGWYSIFLSAAAYKQATGPILVLETCRRSLGFFLLHCFSFHTKRFKSRTVKDSSVHLVICISGHNLVICIKLHQSFHWLQSRERRERTLSKNA